MGELVFGGNFGYTDVALGAVAAAQLPLSDLNIFWKPADDSPSDSQAVVYINFPGGSGDFNGDELVNGVDFMIWQRGGSPDPRSASDLALWAGDFGATSATANLAAVPEPTSLLLCVMGGLAVCGRRRRR